MRLPAWPTLRRVASTLLALGILIWFGLRIGRVEQIVARTPDVRAFFPGGGGSGGGGGGGGDIDSVGVASPIAGGGASGAVTVSMSETGCGAGDVWTFVSTGVWSCDAPAGGSGDLTEVAVTSPIAVSSGTGPIPNVSLSTTGCVDGEWWQRASGAWACSPHDSTVIQSRVSGTCAATNAIREVAAGGTVTCEPIPQGDVTGVSVGPGSATTCTSGNCVLPPSNKRDRFHVFSDFSATTVVGLDFVLSSSGGTGTISGEAGHPGTLVCTAQDAVGDRCGLGTNSLDHIIVGSGVFTAEAVVHYTQLSVAAEEFIGHYGFGDSLTAEPVDGAYIRYDRSTGGDFFQCVTSNNSTRTVLTMDGTGGTTSAPVTAATWRRLTVVVNAAATQVDCYVDGVLSGSVTTNIPTARQTGVIAQTRKTVQTAAVALAWKYDYIEAYWDPTTAR